MNAASLWAFVMASAATHPPVRNCIVSFPTQQILLLTLTRPKQLNCIDLATSRDIQHLWDWFDQNPSLLVGIITGQGRAFCTGADLQGTYIVCLIVANAAD